MSYKATISGNIARIDELRKVGKDKTSVISFAVAINHAKKVDGEWDNNHTTTFINAEVWNRLADDFEKTFAVGDKVIIAGDIVTDEDYTDKNGNVVTPRPKIRASEIGANIIFGDVTVDHSESKSETKSKPKSAAKKSTRKSAAKDSVAPDTDEFDDDVFDDGDDF